MVYAQIWIVCAMAFVFGPMIPLMFPLALLGLFVLLTSLKLRIAYSVKRIPVYDQNINRVLVLSLGYLPLIYLLFAAQLYSNQ